MFSSFFSIPLVYNANEQERNIRIIQETITVQYNIYIILQGKKVKRMRISKRQWAEKKKTVMQETREGFAKERKRRENRWGKIDTETRRRM
jgi:hypothetical protein